MQFGKYQVLEQVGEGGFGRVYKGYDPTLKREVAIKVCTLKAPELRARFVREAEIAANLRHPNVVTVYDFGDESGEPYLVQEFLAGEDLDALIARREPLPLSRKIELLIQIARGLAFAHANGVVHRDVKPSNMRILPDGVVRIMDFGIAKLLEAELQFTQVGMSVGTVGYLSPEQLRGEEVDHRADIFSFGVLAYELLSYEKPFTGDSVTTIFYRIAQEEPPPIATRVPECPPLLAACIERCLRKQRDERFSSCIGVIEQLEAVQAGATAETASRQTVRHAATGSPSGSAVAATEVPASRRRPAVWGLIAAALAVALFGVFNLARWGETTPNRNSTQSEAGAVEGPAPADSEAFTAPPVAVDPDAAVASDNLAERPTRPGPETPEPPTATSAVAGANPPSAGGAGGGTASGGGAAAGGGAAGSLRAERVLVLLVGPAGPLESAEAALVRELLDGGADVVDDVLADDAASAQSGSGLTTLARRFGAGTVLVGQLTAQAQPSVGAFFTGTATLSLKSYDGSTGRLLDVENYQVGAGQTPGKLGTTELAAATEAAAEVGRRGGRAALRRIEAR